MYYQQWLLLDDYCIVMEQIERVKPRAAYHRECMLDEIKWRGDCYHKCGYTYDELKVMSYARLYEVWFDYYKR